MIRRLTRDERALWQRLRHTVRPLRPARLGSDPAELEPVMLAQSAEAQPAKAAPAPAEAAAAARLAPLLLRLDDKARRRLDRGLAGVDATIDLHGMHQERAFAALMTFLRQNQMRGAKLVLVITGKGREGGGEGRGILRQSVPAWLARPDMRVLILGFEAAGRRHGGEGALYVRLRRRR